ncbi:uncharacterized protein UV8b_01030 [Ustilaginoidea virens]|uniref:RNA polymerase II subunit B1 CTD phosphatase RPAP2 homolog n=1 Tax=Ustilaginoidea virens TaxID=1159556 RepID=A0A8E5HJU0_USTVR|nr:uncharacterized protein UV8b_01030 [Ustilaginoidea virens]QUC16789.1 hypothetical protein UV8b_01030 [Ustilaginoidea virens]
MDGIEAKQKQLTSILKSSAAAQAAGARSPAQAAEIALAHAKLLQHRKDLESDILDSLILLSEYPLVRHPACTAARPAQSDASGFKTHVRLFQPSDYDDLVQERNVNGLCGYSLCARPRRQVGRGGGGGGGKWKLMGSGDIVRREDLEKWCSAACARRALFVKVQLNETAAWERAGIPDIQIDLLDEQRPAETEPDRAARELSSQRLDERRRLAAADAETLALERGERRVAERAEKVQVVLREKATKPPRPEDASTWSDDDYLQIEGRGFSLPERPRPRS